MILMVGPVPGPGSYIGGIGTLISTLLEFWDLPFHVRLYNTDTGPRDFGSTNQLNGHNLKRCLHTAFGLFRAVRQHRPALIHLHTSRHRALLKDMLLAAMAKAASNAKLVAHLHWADYSSLFVGSSPAGRRRQIQILTALFNRVILMSQGIRAQLESELPPTNRHQFSEQTVALHNCVPLPPLRARPGPQHAPLKCLFLGNVGPRKGVFDLIAAARRLGARSSKRIELVLAGPFDSPAVAAEVRQAIELSDLHDRVRLTGAVQGAAKADLFLQADIFALPSYGEGLPLAMLEAMSYGLPVVATRVGAIPEVVADGHAAFLVTPGNIHELSTALQTLGADPALRRRMGDCGRAQIEHSHTPGRFLRRLESLYREILSEPIHASNP